MFQCVHALRYADGCSRSAECDSCTVRASIKKAAQGQCLAREKARLAVQRDRTETELFFEVTAAPLSFEGFCGAVVTMEDIGQGVELERAQAEIATILKCSPRAIEYHRHNLRRKLRLTGNGLSLASQLARFE